MLLLDADDKVSLVVVGVLVLLDPILWKCQCWYHGDLSRMTSSVETEERRADADIWCRNRD